jgi:transposase-like protein
LIQGELESGLEKGPDESARGIRKSRSLRSPEHEAGVKTADLCRKHGISEASFYNWKSKYGGLEVSEAKRLAGLDVPRPKRLT